MKNLIKSLKILTILLLLNGFLIASIDYVKGAELLQTGVSPVGIGLLGAYAAENEYLEMLPVNPAVAAGLNRPNIFFTYSGFTTGQLTKDFNIFYCQPTKIGIFSIGTTALLSDKLELASYIQPAIIFSKEISTKFTFGFSIHADVAKSWNTNISTNTNNSGTTYKAGGGGLDLSLQYSDNTRLKKPIGMSGTKIGFIFKNIGHNPYFKDIYTDKEKRVKTPEIQAGYSFKFIDAYGEKGGFATRLYFDLNIIPIPKALNLKLLTGTKMSIHINKGLFDTVAFLASVSIIQSDTIGMINMGRWGVGALLKLRLGFTALNFNYGVTPTTLNNKKTFIHAFSVNIAIGKKDKTKPEIDLGDFQDEDVIELN